MTLRERRSKWKGHRLKLWNRVCLRCGKNKRMLHGNYICDSCKRGVPHSFGRQWGSEIYNI